MGLYTKKKMPKRTYTMMNIFMNVIIYNMLN